MSFLAPLAFAFSLLAVPILLLYMLKLRRREQPVSSTLLWRMVLRDRQANSPWQRIQRSLLLILQLLVLSALVLALARPTLAVPGISSQAVVLLLDASASMQAQDVQPNRFEAAKQAAARLLDDLSSTTRTTLIIAAPQPEVLISAETDRGALQRSLASAQVSQGEADWNAAFRLAIGAMRGVENSSLVILSDGGLPPAGLPPVPGEVHYLPIGASPDNLAITALALRPSAQGVELFASLKNFGNQDHRTVFSLYQEGQLIDAREVNLPAREQASIVLEGLEAGPAEYVAQLSPAAADFYLDPLAADNIAYAVYQPPVTAQVLLVSSGNLFLEQILASLPDIQAFRSVVTENEPPPAPTSFDTVVYDGVLPDELPAANLLLVNPPSNALFAVTGTFTNTAPVRLSSGPRTEFQDWSGVQVRRARQVALPEWAQALVSAPGGPLVFTGETAGRRVAVITFDLHESDLPLQIAYPVLMASLFNYLNPGAGGLSLPENDTLRPGDSLQIAPSWTGGTWLVTTPEGEVIPLEAGENGAIFSQTTEPGIYQIRAEGADGNPAYSFAVNLFSDSESNLSVRTELPIGQVVVPAGLQEDKGRKEIWPWLAAIALFLLLLEWWVYYLPQKLTAPA